VQLDATGLPIPVSVLSVSCSVPSSSGRSVAFAVHEHRVLLRQRGYLCVAVDVAQREAAQLQHLLPQLLQPGVQRRAGGCNQMVVTR
jgi:hypothetical protein